MLMNQNDKVKAVRVFAKWQIGVGVFGSLVFVAFFLMLRGGKNADERTWYSFLFLSSFLPSDVLWDILLFVAIHEGFFFISVNRPASLPAGRQVVGRGWL